MASFGVNVPPGIACTTVDEVAKAAKDIGGDEASLPMQWTFSACTCID